MLKLGDLDQIKNELAGKTGLIDEYEDQLEKRIAEVELEQDDGTNFSIGNKIAVWSMIVFSICALFYIIL